MSNLFVSKMEEFNGYERFDVCYGVVDSVCSVGAFLTLDDNEKAFSYECASLPIGAKIMCTVLKKARIEEGKRMLVSFDSRLDEFEMAC